LATLPHEMLATAELLANVGSPLRSAGLTRSVSTAYYALFTRLAALCARQIARAARTSESFKTVYRSVDHGPALKALDSHAEFGPRLGDSFKRLQEARHWADYRSDPHPAPKKAAEGILFTRAEALEFVAIAREAIQWVDALTPDAKQRLAVLLVARSRR
jgi:hypothetical protein